MSEKRNVAVIGLGTFGAAVARELTHVGDTVLGIDQCEKRVQSLSGEIAQVLQADSTDQRALQECDLKSYDTVIVSIGENVEASVITAMNAMDMNCPTVWVKAQNSTQRRILKAIGVHHVVLPEQAYGQRIAQIVHNPGVQDFLALGGDRYLVRIEMANSDIAKILEDESKLREMDITNLGIYADGRLTDVKSFRSEENVSHSALLVGKRANLRRLADSL